MLHRDGRAELHSAAIEAEFPQSDAGVAGTARTQTVHVTGYRDMPFPHAIARMDWRSGRDARYDFGDRQLVEEFIFVPRGVAAREGDGWLVGTTLNLAARATELHILDADRLSDGPVATWRASVPLPIGFHGRFIA